MPFQMIHLCRKLLVTRTNKDQCQSGARRVNRRTSWPAPAAPTFSACFTPSTSASCLIPRAHPYSVSLPRESTFRIRHPKFTLLDCSFQQQAASERDPFWSSMALASVRNERFDAEGLDICCSYLHAENGIGLSKHIRI